MARVVVLDAGPLMLISKPRGLAPADRCRAWIHALDAAGARVEVPEIADYEVRRELLRVGAPAALKRLDRMESGPGGMPTSSWAHPHQVKPPEVRSSSNW